MAKFKYEQEFAFRASPKVLYNYISTPGGLQRWFADKVTLDADRNFIFEWDGGEHIANLSSARLNKATRFDFMGKDEGNYLEFKFSSSNLDSTTYFRITDNSNNDDVDDLKSMWDELVEELREIVGG